MSTDKKRRQTNHGSPCGICPRFFKSKKEKIDHETEHEKMKHVCTCGCAFLKYKGYKIHLTRCQSVKQKYSVKGDKNESVTFNTGRGAFPVLQPEQVRKTGKQCHLCGRKFRQLKKLEFHMVHHSELQYRCPHETCRWLFYDYNDLTIHTRNSHKFKIFNRDKLKCLNEIKRIQRCENMKKSSILDNQIFDCDVALDQNSENREGSEGERSVEFENVEKGIQDTATSLVTKPNEPESNSLRQENSVNVESVIVDIDSKDISLDSALSDNGGTLNTAAPPKPGFPDHPTTLQCPVDQCCRVFRRFEDFREHFASIHSLSIWRNEAGDIVDVVHDVEPQISWNNIGDSQLSSPASSAILSTPHVISPNFDRGSNALMTNNMDSRDRDSYTRRMGIYENSSFAAGGVELARSEGATILPQVQQQISRGPEETSQALFAPWRPVGVENIQVILETIYLHTLYSFTKELTLS